MAETKGVNGFCDEDQFLRRIAFPDHVKRGLLFWRAFKERAPSLSWTLKDESLLTNDALNAYRRHYSASIPSGLPGLCWLSFRGLPRELNPPLVPCRDPDRSDPVYGHLHCSTPSPTDKSHMEKMAKLVNDGVYGRLLCGVSELLEGERR